MQIYDRWMNRKNRRTLVGNIITGAPSTARMPVRSHTLALSSGKKYLDGRVC